MGNISCCNVVEKKLTKFFRNWGHLVSKKPLWFIISSLLFGIITGIFMFRLESETGTEELYAPSNSLSSNNGDKYKDTWQLFEDFARTNDIMYTDNDRNVYTLDDLIYLLSIHKQLSNIEIEYEGNLYKYSDICTKNIEGQCNANNVLEFWLYDENILLSTFNDTQLTYPEAFSFWSSINKVTLLMCGEPVGIELQNYTTIIDVPFTFVIWYVMDILKIYIKNIET